MEVDDEIGGGGLEGDVPMSPSLSSPSAPRALSTEYAGYASSLAFSASAAEEAAARDLPFLVTRWLSHYGRRRPRIAAAAPTDMVDAGFGGVYPSAVATLSLGEGGAGEVAGGGGSGGRETAAGGSSGSGSGNDAEEKRKEEAEEGALRRIRHAAAELALAFEELGAYGMTASMRSVTSASPRGVGGVSAAGGKEGGRAVRPAAYRDLARRHASLPPDQLRSIVASAASASAAAEVAAAGRSSSMCLSFVARSGSGRLGVRSALAAAEEGAGVGVAVGGEAPLSSLSSTGGERMSGVGDVGDGVGINGETNSGPPPSSFQEEAPISLLRPPATFTALSRALTRPSPVVIAASASPVHSGRPPNNPSATAAGGGGGIGIAIDESDMIEFALSIDAAADELREDDGDRDHDRDNYNPGASAAVAQGASGGEAGVTKSRRGCRVGDGSVIPRRQMTVALSSDFARLDALAGAAFRDYVSLRTRRDDEAREIQRVRAVAAERSRRRDREVRGGSGGGGGVAAAVAAIEATTPSDESGERVDRDDERVIAQLERRLAGLVVAHASTEEEARRAGAKAAVLRAECLAARRGYGDPFERGGGGGSTLGLGLGFGGGPRPTNPLSFVVARQYRGGGGTAPRPFSSRSSAALGRTRKRLVSCRLSHCVTASCHLIYPVYCLRFDRTGRYFVTGADDHLAKVFHLGAGISTVPNAAGRARCSYGANARGAVLVCTLRGHAGVITDVDVSVDNVMLATASEDGDVRVWGMRDGAPIAILRGHAGGANMVSWSATTPYRLVTTGQDGLARAWDVRDAALKRYGGVVGARAGYVLPKVRCSCQAIDKKSSSEEDEEDDDDDGSEVDAENDGEDDIALPPLPIREGEGASSNGTANADASAIGGAMGMGAGDGGIFIPPLPPGAEGLPIGAGNGVIPGVEGLPIGAGNVVNPGVGINANPLSRDSVRGGNNHNGAFQPGAFVSGDAIDEGVVLISKMQHGDIVHGDQFPGPSTRSQRKAVKVICLSRCPLGGHFATGSDDGLGRIWADEDDDQVAQIDYHLTNGRVSGEGSPRNVGMAKRKSGRLQVKRNFGRGNAVPSKSSLLANLPGHLNSVTDVQYSNAGDRIITASQKDGVVRIWSWGTESAVVKPNPHDPSSPSKVSGNKLMFDNIKQILIRLTLPPDCLTAGGSNLQSSSSRRRGGLSSGSSAMEVSCDVAVWSSDDSKVITSQTCSIKAGGHEIVPGSHVLYVWDSRSGRCLTGISAAHNAPCPVLTCHPFDSTIVASAGGDGRVNVWDLDTGKRIFGHENRLTHGPVDPPSNRGKIAGFLDGSFSPDGLYLVLTDDSGRVTVLDTLLSAGEAKDSRVSETAAASPKWTLSNPIMHDPRDVPDWMKEQYFGNDYYDLFYDSNGYCIERGSEKPPHLAPRAARCNHMGEAYFDRICEAFAHVAGPQPLLEEEVRWRRDNLRVLRLGIRQPEGLLVQNTQGRKTAINSCSSGTECRIYESSFASLLRKIGAKAPAQPAEKIRQALSAATALNDTVNEERSSQPTRALSSRYRWIGYEDMRDDAVEIEDEDDDEDYLEVPRGRRLYNDEEASVVSGIAEEDMGDEAASDGDSNSQRVSRSSSRRPSAGRRLGGTGRRRRSAQRAVAAAPPAARSHRRERRDRDRARHVAFEEQQRQQPTRVSARQMSSPSRQRRRYEIPDSDDDDLIEEMSTNRVPSGDFIEDYTVRGHLFRLPDRGVVHRNWLCRTESKSGMSGRKPYAPQVGDSVVYIPRAHKETIQEFPSADNSVAPWKSWPTSSAWPVVQCAVRDIRYRFPYENYYRNRRGSTCKSIVAIVTLEVTGIPQIAPDRIYPWLKPDFISRLSRSAHKTFELSVFENHQPEFLIPEHLYRWKILELERAVAERGSDLCGLRLVSYFEPEEGDEGFGTEDPDLVLFQCTVESIRPPEEEELHFQNSGYNAFDVRWEGSGEINVLSTWEVTVLDSVMNVPPPPTLHDEEKAALYRILDSIEEDRKVRMNFLHSVNTSRYSDYLNMIEVPMTLEFIRQRLENDYYTNKLSFLSDVKLIRDNCLKYNDNGSDLSTKASEMYDSAKEMIYELPDYPRQQVTLPLAESSRPGSSSARNASLRSSRLTSPRSLTQPDAPPSRRIVQTRPSTRLSEQVSSAAGSSTSLENLPCQESIPQSASTRRIRLTIPRAAAVAPALEVARSTRSARSSGRNGKSIDEHSSEKDEEDDSDELDGSHDGNSVCEDSSSEDDEKHKKVEVEVDRCRMRTRASALSHTPSEGDLLQEEEDGKGQIDEPEDDEIRRCTRSSSRSKVASAIHGVDNEDEGTSSEEEEEEEEEEEKVEDYEPEDSGNRIRTRACTRSNMLSASQVASSEGDDESSEEECKWNGAVEHESSKRARANPRQNRSNPRTVRSSRRARTMASLARKPPNSSAGSNRKEEEHSGIAPPTRRSTRIRKFPKKLRDDFSSNEEGSIEDIKSLNESVQSEGPRTKETDSDEDEESSNKRSRKTVSYAEVGSSDIESAYGSEDGSVDDESTDEGNASDSSEEIAVSQGRRSNKRRKAPKRTRGKKARKSSQPAAKYVFYPALARWPPVVPSSKIMQVGKRIIDIVSMKDTEEVFSRPVTEEFPDMADSYLRIVAKPMDFRTILEERMPCYSNFDELQDDLILTYKNCCNFNGEDSKFYFYAIDRWKNLNNVFRQACEEEGIEIPRRWS